MRWERKKGHYNRRACPQCVSSRQQHLGVTLQLGEVGQHSQTLLLTLLWVKLRGTNRIVNYKMDVDMTDGIKYKYKMRKGISRIKGGILILEEMKYPTEILDMIRKYD